MPNINACLNLSSRTSPCSSLVNVSGVIAFSFSPKVSVSISAFRWFVQVFDGSLALPNSDVELLDGLVVIVPSAPIYGLASDWVIGTLTTRKPPLLLVWSSVCLRRDAERQSSELACQLPPRRNWKDPEEGPVESGTANSETFPYMSYKPHRFGFLSPTGCVSPLLFPANQA